MKPTESLAECIARASQLADMNAAFSVVQDHQGIESGDSASLYVDAASETAWPAESPEWRAAYLEQFLAFHQSLES
jgi:hypothetical protein